MEIKICVGNFLWYISRVNVNACQAEFLVNMTLVYLLLSKLKLQCLLPIPGSPCCIMCIYSIKPRYLSKVLC